MNYRFIPYKEYNPYRKTALNEVALRSVKDGGDPIVWFSGWDRETVNIGNAQTVGDEVNEEFIRQESICLVRRQGGGGAVFLAPGNELSWSMVLPTSMVSDSKREVYRDITSTLIATLKELGATAKWEPVNDVVIGNRKVSGGTMKQSGSATYIGATLIYDFDAERMFTALTPDAEKYEAKGYESIRDRVTSVKKETGVSFKELRSVFKKHILRDKQWRTSEWTGVEQRHAKHLQRKYESDEWVHRNNSSRN